MDKHDLHHEFPEHHQKIHDLKIGNTHFKKLFDDYHKVNNEIYRIETGVEATSDEVLNDFRMNRVFLKDEIYAMLLD
jgi:uncharacterized protein YdcH (DUF465 family)